MRSRDKPNVIYALWKNESLQQNSSSPSMRDITLSWLRFGYQRQVLEADSVDSILKQAVQNGGDICVIQSPGNVISEDWKLPHWNCSDFYQCIEHSFRDLDFLLCADFRKIENHYYIDTQLFVVNLRKYEELGQPEFGDRIDHKVNLTQAEAVAVESTASQDIQRCLRARKREHLILPASSGWNLVNTTLKHHLKLPALPKAVSTKRLSLLDKPSGDKNSTGKDSQTSKFINGVKAQLQQCQKGVFLWNIESYDDIQSNDDYPEDLNHHIKNLYCVAAGFKPNMLLRRYGYNEDTCITFFDYSEQALGIRKRLIEEWDGKNYPAFCREIINDFTSKDVFFQLWDGLTPSEINWRDVEQLWMNELEHWGGSRAFQHHWERHRHLHYRYILCDLVNDPREFINTINNSPQSVIWWSNAFFTISSNWTLSISQRKQRFIDWITRLADKAPECRIYGADYVNRPINNINAITYLRRLQTHISEHPSDELIPYQEQALPLRF